MINEVTLFSDMVISTVNNTYTNCSLRDISCRTGLRPNTLNDIVIRRNIPGTVSSLKHVCDALSIDFSAAYDGWLLERFPEQFEWIKNFDINSCTFSDLIKYYRISHGLTREEMDSIFGFVKFKGTIRYESGNILPSVQLAERMSDIMDVDRAIVLKSLIKQSIGRNSNYRYGSLSEDYLENSPYIVDTNMSFNELLLSRVKQLSISSSEFAGTIGIANHHFALNGRLCKVVRVRRISNVISHLNLDLYSVLDVYHRDADLKLFNTNFGNIVYIVSACIGISTTEFVRDIIGMQPPTVWRYAANGRVPCIEYLSIISASIGLDVDTLINTFKLPCNYDYIKQYAYESARYVISNYWNRLSNINVHIIKQLFSE